MQRHFPVFRPYQMVHDVRSRGAATAIAEPLLADVTHDDRARFVDTAVATGVRRQLLTLGHGVIFVFLELQFTDGGCYAGDFQLVRTESSAESIELCAKGISHDLFKGHICGLAVMTYR